jgi:ATP-dependent 26S proteasome regulatory subunit
VSAGPLRHPTTNYPEKLDPRIRSRPRRFDRVLRIESPNMRFRDVYFGRKVPDLSAKERRHWVEISDGLSFASLAELVISVRCLDNDLMETATQLRELETHQPSSDEEEAREFETARNGRFSSRRSLDAEIPF